MHIKTSVWAPPVGAAEFGCHIVATLLSGGTQPDLVARLLNPSTGLSRTNSERGAAAAGEGGQAQAQEVPSALVALHLEELKTVLAVCSDHSQRRPANHIAHVHTCMSPQSLEYWVQMVFCSEVPEGGFPPALGVAGDLVTLQRGMASETKRQDAAYRLAKARCVPVPCGARSTCASLHFASWHEHRLVVQVGGGGERHER